MHANKNGEAPAWKEIQNSSGRCSRELQDEACAGAGAVAVNGEGPVQFLRGNGAGMQANTTAFLFRYRPLMKDARDIFGGNADAVVDDSYLDEPAVHGFNADGYFFVRRFHLVEGLMRIGN